MVIRDEILDELLGSREIKTQDDLFGQDGILKQLSKRLMERLLEAEMTNHLGYHRHAIEGHNSGVGIYTGTIIGMIVTGVILVFRFNYMVKRICISPNTYETKLASM